MNKIWEKLGADERREVSWKDVVSKEVEDRIMIMSADSTVINPYTGNGGTKSPPARFSPKLGYFQISHVDDFW